MAAAPDGQRLGNISPAIKHENGTISDGKYTMRDKNTD
jgi:hypothetical protein